MPTLGERRSVTWTCCLQHSIGAFGTGFAVLACCSRDSLPSRHGRVGGRYFGQKGYSYPAVAMRAQTSHCQQDWRIPVDTPYHWLELTPNIENNHVATLHNMVFCIQTYETTLAFMSCTS